MHVFLIIYLLAFAFAAWLLFSPPVTSRPHNGVTLKHLRHHLKYHLNPPIRTARIAARNRHLDRTPDVRIVIPPRQIAIGEPTPHTDSTTISTCRNPAKEP